MASLVRVIVFLLVCSSAVLFLGFLFCLSVLLLPKLLNSLEEDLVSNIKGKGE